MTTMRIKDFPELQAAVIKSMYKQVKDRCNDGKWRDFNADMTISGQRVHFSCKFRLTDMFLEFSNRELRDNNNQLVIPEKSILVPPV
jgi:hypothetical protein